MLKFSQMFCEDAWSNNEIKKAINDKLIEIVEVVYELTTDEPVKDLDEFSAVVDEALEEVFPINYDVHKRAINYYQLLEVLKSQDELVPQLVQEYVLNSVLESYIAFHEDLLKPDSEKDESIFNVKIDNEETVVKNIKKCDYEQSFENVIQYMEYIKDVRNFFDFCFWDIDFKLLDEYDEDAIKKNLGNKMGIENIPEKINYIFNYKD